MKAWLEHSFAQLFQRAKRLNAEDTEVNPRAQRNANIAAETQSAQSAQRELA